MAEGHQTNMRIPPDDWQWLESHPGLRAQDAIRALIADGRQRDVKITTEMVVRVEEPA